MQTPPETVEAPPAVPGEEWAAAVEAHQPNLPASALALFAHEDLLMWVALELHRQGRLLDEMMPFARRGAALLDKAPSGVVDWATRRALKKGGQG